MLGERIKELRRNKGYSQQQLAQKLHITQGAISQWERNATMPASDQLNAIADIFEITVDELLNGIPPDKGKIVITHQPKTEEARILAAGIDRMPEADRKRALEIINMVFTQYKEFFEGVDANDG